MKPMKIKLLLLIFLIGLLIKTEAQGTFQKVSVGVDDYIFSIKQSSASQYVALGYTQSFGAGAFDFYLLKFDGDGNLLWNKAYGGPENDLGYSVIPTLDSGFLMLGTSQSFGAGSADVLLIKVDNAGEIEWSKTFGGFAWDDGFEMDQTDDGGYIIAGRTTSYGAGSGDVYLIRLDANGEYIWNKTFGGFNNEDAQQVIQTTEGEFVIVGHTTSYGAGNADVYLIKTDGTGDLIWAKTYGGANFDYGNSIEQTSDGGFILTGNTNSFGLVNADVLLMKLDNDGNVSWTKTYGGTETDYGHYVKQTNDGGFVIAGQSNSWNGDNIDAYFIRTDNQGDTLWTKVFGGPGDDFSNAIDFGHDGGFVSVGNSWSFGNNSRGYLIKMDDPGDSNCFQHITTTIVNSPQLQTGIGAMVNAGISINEPVIEETTASNADSSICNITVGLNTAAQLWEFRLYPNPIVQKSILEINNFGQDYSFQLHNNHGQMVQRMDKLSGNRIEIDKQHLISGIYFFQVISDLQVRARGKVIIY